MRINALKSATLLALISLALDPVTHSHAKPITKKLTPKLLVAASTPIDTSIAANNLGTTAINANGQIVATTAAFWEQLATPSAAHPGGTYASNPAVALQGRISVAPADVGQSGEIFIVAVYNGSWYMRTEVLTGPPGQQTPQDSWVPWNLQLAQLQPTGPAQTLTV